ncbi:MAG: sigma 54 modulation/S30EA ribosomal C-terminal domain-containing protein [Acidimicrobiales bacterium]
MPDGVVLWFDAADGVGRIVAGGREYPVEAREMSPPSRVSGARVHFDIDRHGPAARNVELRRGTRTSPRQGRFGDLSGAHSPAARGPFASAHPELAPGLVTQPVRVARAWANAIARRDVAGAAFLYAPDATLHTPAGSSTGRRQVIAALEAADLPVGPPEVRAEDRWIGLVWTHGDDETATWLVVDRGEIVEQWLPGAEPPGEAIAAPGEPFPLETATRGPVPDEALLYARSRVLAFAQQTAEPILFARVKLGLAMDPARTKRAEAQATLDVNGRPLRAHVAAHTLHEAVDLLERRLRDRLGHRADREVRRPDALAPEPGEWRHGNLAAIRPNWYPRPVDEREIVRHKPLAPEPLTVEEAAFDLEQLDYEFYLFRELASGEDSLLARTERGLTLHQAEPRPELVHLGAAPVSIDAHGAPELGVEEAVERLNSDEEPHVFFVDRRAGRGSVLYRRYDGHYGLITLEPAAEGATQG